MLRPERMSRVSVTGTERVMADVVEAVHDLNLVHLSAYDGSWEGFDQGDPMDGAEAASDTLVTVRSVESILGVDPEDARGRADVGDVEAIEDELEPIREEVNELDDRRDELRDELRDIEERLEAAEPFLDLGIDLDLLSGYDRLAVRVGEGDPDAIRARLDEALDAPFEVHTGDDAVGIFADADRDALEDALVGVEFNAVEVPDAEGDPEAYVADLEDERERVRARLDTVEDELEELRLEAASFLLAAEERLDIEVQKAEAPLRFATTANAFVAEGWVPTERYEALATAVRDAAGDHVEVEELERADYDQPHHGHGEAATDGGTTMDDDTPPVVQDNPGPVKPFELLVETINRPQYWDLDPTVVLFLAFPAFFGFMIGDVGYGLLYLGLGYWLRRSFESDGLRSLGGIGMWAGGFTVLFGLLYGEIFGFHLISTFLWEGALGLHGPPMHKGLQPADIAFAQTWLVVVMLAGLLHLSLGYVFGFVQFARGHGLRDAVLEKGSWLTLMTGVWLWIFSTHGAGVKPSFLYTVFNAAGAPIPGASATVSEVQVAYPLGFGGLPETAGLAGLGVAVLGFVLLLAGEGAQGLLEFLDVLVNVLSYARIAAVLLAKAGMAFVVNLIAFGVYTEGDPAEYHFMLSHGPQYVLEHKEGVEILFGGLVHSGIAGVLVGIVILVLGHAIVLALGITSAGLQALRLQYYEFFSKFYYEGGAGETYEPFGRERVHTGGE